jgi:hypothetical protein
MPLKNKIERILATLAAFWLLSGPLLAAPPPILAAGGGSPERWDIALWPIPVGTTVITTSGAHLYGFAVSNGVANTSACHFVLADGSGNSPADWSIPPGQSVPFPTPWGMRMAGGFTVTSDVTGCTLTAQWGN